MKISYRTHEVLRFIKDKYIDIINLLPQDLDRYKSVKEPVIDPIWEMFSTSFGSDIKYLTQPFFEALLFAMPKIMDSGMWKDALSMKCSGTVIHGAATYCYDIKPIGNNKIKIFLFFFRDSEQNGHPVLQYFFWKDESIPRLVAWISSDPDILSGESPEDHNVVQRVANDAFKSILSIIAFLQYADVQTKYLQGGKKIDDISCKYVNDTDSLVKIIDCTWITNLVKSEGFNVRGHLRLQPKKKNGKWTKQIIWIEEFKKHGYTRKAGILNKVA
jgi:hypothetical protein